MHDDSAVTELAENFILDLMAKLTEPLWGSNLDIRLTEYILLGQRERIKSPITQQIPVDTSFFDKYVFSLDFNKYDLEN